jgi:hypothetical protein
MKLNKGVSYPKKGMQRDKHPSELSKEEYTFALNANFQSEQGDGIVILQNEGSNLLCSGFKDGYSVIGHKYDLNADRVYFFLTNQTTGCSEIGYIDSISRLDDIEAAEVECGCNLKVTLENPLENTVQQGFCNYQTLLSDCCDDFPDAPKCLNFNINYPIHESNVEIKDERTGKRLYFTDGLNPPRYIRLDDLHIYYEIDEACEQPTPACLQCDKMRVFPLFDKPCISVEAVSGGGNLRKGIYEVTMAYCNSRGEELSNYYSTTNPVHIFDQNQRVLTQDNLDALTNFSIKVNFEDLDKSFEYYKVVVVYRSGLDQSLTNFVVGVFSVSTDSVYVKDTKNKDKITDAELKEFRPFVEKAKGLTAANGHLFLHGLKTQRDINLQPVVSLMGGFVKWMTVMAREDLYEDGSNVSNFTGYMRDEVVPLSITFYRKGGRETATFPFVARPPKPDELIPYLNENGGVIVEDLNVISVNSGAKECGGTTRRFKWQYENTATIDEDLCLVPASTVGTINVEREEEFICVVSNEDGPIAVDEIVGPESFSFESSESIVDYINNNKGDILSSTDPQWDDVKDILSGDYPDDTCTPDIPSNCDDLEIESVEIFALNVAEEGSVSTPFTFADFARVPAPDQCSTIQRDTNGDPIRDSSFESSFMSPTAIVYSRSILTNTTCSFAVEVFPFLNPTLAPTYHLRPLGQVGADNLLLSTKSADASGSIYRSNLHQNAIWFKVTFNGRDLVPVELSVTVCDLADDVTDNRLRVTVYPNCTTNSNISSYTKYIANTQTFNDPNKFLVLDAVDFPDGVAYIAIDSPIVMETIGPDDIYRLHVPCGCFKAFQREMQYLNSVTVSGLTFGKRIIYRATCEYALPDMNQLDACTAIPYQKGEFAYWESIYKYPCNPELWDSSVLDVRVSDIPVEFRDKFEDYYTSGLTGSTYIMDPTKSDFQDKPIRHYKFPCTKKVPHMSDFTQNLGSFKKQLIFPIGFTIDAKIIEALLDVAVRNNLITLEERNSIEKYEIFRGDRRSEQSVIAKGILFDTYQYNESNVGGNDRVFYANYPLNSLGQDQFNVVKHPQGSLGNTHFAFYSPDTLFYQPTLPPELKVEGFLLGRARHSFNEVLDHPKNTLLGQNAFTIATTLAVAEVTFDVFLQGATWVQQAVSGHPLTAAPATVIAAVAIGQLTLQSFFKVGQIRQQWINSFRGIGKPQQFAYYQAVVGHYDTFFPNTVANSQYRSIPIRTYLKEGRWNVNNPNPLQPNVSVNNMDREGYVFLGTEQLVTYDPFYNSTDNTNLSPSNATRRRYDGVGRATSIESNTSVLYATLKNYYPGQYGTINSIEWLSTNFCGKIGVHGECNPIFGGDTYISRFAVKRKFPFFTTTAIGLGNNTPFKYSDYFNINPVIPGGSIPASRYYLDYLLNDSFNFPLAAVVFPNNRSQFNLDYANTSQFYIEPPAKFYLFSYGYPYFLVESVFNCNFRYAKTQPAEDFYPHNQDVLAMTEERNVPIREPERFFYNTVYLTQGNRNRWSMLPEVYQRTLFDRINNQRSTVMYSRIDSSETDITDPWLSYRALDINNFDTSFGDLVDMKGIESDQILARFNNGFSIFGAVDVLADRLDPSLNRLGAGGIFAGRTVNFNKTKLGYAGSQTTPMVNCNFGHFWADPKRGQVFQLEPGGKGLKEITSGLEKWFKDNLPFKILKDFPNYNVDNNYNGVGIAMGWDERHKRVFLTKKDYIYVGEGLELIDGEFYTQGSSFSCDQDNILPPFGTGEIPQPWSIVGSWSASDGVAIFTPSGSGSGALSIRRGLQEGCYTLTGTVCNYSGSFVTVILADQSYLLDTQGCSSFELEFQIPAEGTYTLRFEPRDDEGFEGFSTLTNLCLIPCPSLERVSIQDERYFQECSWTAAYSPLVEGWISYYSFKPNYYVDYNDYFQTGLNNGQASIWSHLPFISSYQVFYGQKYPFTVEYPLISQGANSVLQDINYYLDVRKYYNTFDFADIYGHGFNKAWVYNNDQNSGELRLNFQDKNKLSQLLQYPRHNANNIEILQTEQHGRWSFNYIYNLIRNEKSGLPVWIHDCANVEKFLDSRLLNYKNNYKDRIRGQYFLVRLSQDIESRFKMIFRYSMDTRGYYE